MYFHKNSSLFKAFLLFLFCAFISSCEDDKPSKGTITFSFTESNSGTNSRVHEAASKLLISISDNSGTLIQDKTEISLYDFEGEFISEPLVLQAGNYFLKEFIVLNADNQVIYVAPIEGSALEYLVEEPLPLAFTVSIDEVTKVTPEVISAEGHSAVDFGYTTFSFNVVNTIRFLSAAFVYTSGELVLTQHNLTVKSGSDTLYHGTQLNATVATRVISNKDSYTLIFTKSGYLPIEKTLPKSELIAEYSNQPLTVVFIPETLNTGLIAHYPFNGNANDVTSNQFNGIVNGAQLTTDKDGQTNSAYLFDGTNDYISINHNNAFNFANSDFTISLWAFIPTDQVPHNGINDIIRKWNGDAQGYPYSISYSNTAAADPNHRDRMIHARYDGQACGNITQSFSGLVDNAIFQHIVLQKNGTVLRQYLNNVLVAEFNDQSSISCTATNNANVTIGCRGNLVRFFKGKLDNIRFYNRALSENEIATLYNAE